MCGGDSRRRCASAHSRPSLLWTLAVIGAVSLGSWGCAGLPMKTGSDARTVQIVSHEVAPGETLASIADDFYGNPEAATYLKNVNGIPWDAEPAVGSLLEVPVGSEDMERYDRRTEAKILYNRGTILAGQGDLEKAAEAFRAALRIDPRFADAGYNLGVVLLRSGDASRAVTVLEQVARVREDDPDVMYALGSARLESGSTAAALRDFEDVVAIDPLHEDARFSRALALLELGRTDEAIFQLDLYLREFPQGEWSSAARTRLLMLGAGRETTD